MAKLPFVFLSVALAGCVPQGDFGRPKQSLAFNNLPSSLAEKKGEGAKTVAQIPFTDAEKKMRDVGYVVLYAPDLSARLGPQPRFVRYSSFQGKTLLTADTYYEKLMSDRSQSSKTRYNRLNDDIEKDRRALSSFEPAALRVIAADQVRRSLLKKHRDAEGPHVLLRISENNRFMDLVLDTSSSRAEIYETTLRRLTVDQPEPEAQKAFNALERLKRQQTKSSQALNSARAKRRGSSRRLLSDFQEIDTAEQSNSLANPR